MQLRWISGSGSEVVAYQDSNSTNESARTLLNTIKTYVIGISREWLTNDE